MSKAKKGSKKSKRPRSKLQRPATFSEIEPFLDEELPRPATHQEIQRIFDDPAKAIAFFEARSLDQHRESGPRLLPNVVLIAALGTDHPDGRRFASAEGAVAIVEGKQFAMDNALLEQSGGVLIPYQSIAARPQAEASDWAWAILGEGASAVAEVATQLAVDQPNVSNASMLNFLGDAVSRALRRRLLLNTLKRCRFNLTRCSDLLRMTGSTNVLRAIRDLGLEAEYEAAKAARSE
jgi:hypothetical protein